MPDDRDATRPTMRVLAIPVLALAAAGCVARPTEINGHKVVGTRWVNGHVVYVLAESESDQARMRDSARAAEEASKGVVFKPSRPAR